MHERLGYYMYRNFGINAPRSNHALIYVNGEFTGLFANTENIDGPYTNQHFDGGGGNLYKEVWPVNSEGESRSDEYFKDGLKTNEEISDVSKIKSFSNLLSESEKSEVKSVVENWIDKDISTSILPLGMECGVRNLHISLVLAVPHCLQTCLKTQ